LNTIFQLLGKAVSPSIDEIKAQAETAEQALISAFSVLAGELLVVILLLVALIIQIRRLKK